MFSKRSVKRPHRAEVRTTTSKDFARDPLFRKLMASSRDTLNIR
jgi:hypothetical protein